jgi:hypothetical protein
VIRAYVGLTVFDILVCAGGFLTLEGLGLARFLGRARSLGLAFFSGWAASGVVMSLAACFGWYPGPLGVAGALVLTGAIGFSLGRLFPRSEPADGMGTTSAAERVLAIVGQVLVAFALICALATAAASSADGNWDVWAFWLPKANAIYYFHGLQTGLSGFSTFANPEYPPLFPVMTAATYHFMGGAHPALLPLQACVLGVSFVASVAVVLRPYVRAWILYPALAMLCLAPEFWGRLGTVLPDQLVGYFLAGATLACALWLIERRKAWLGLATLLLAAASLTKTEGLMLGVLLVVLVVASSFVLGRVVGLPAVMLCLGPAAYLPWRRWLAAHDQPLSTANYSWSKLFDPHYLDQRTHRLSFAAGHLSHFVFSQSIWSFVTPVGLAAAVLALVAAPEIALPLLAWVGIGFAGLLTTYWIGVPDIHWYIETSAQRVIATLPIVVGTATPLLVSLALGHVRVQPYAARERTRRPRLGEPDPVG